MSEPVTALKGASFDGSITIRDAGPTGMVTLRGDLASSSMAQAVRDAVGCAMPDPRSMTREGGDAALWMSPDELLLLCDYDAATTVADHATAALGDAHAMVQVVSDARAMLTLEGPAVRDVLAKLAPADLRPAALPVGEVRRTRLAQVAGAFWLESDTQAQVICFRSVAHYVFDLLADAAAPGTEVGYV